MPSRVEVTRAISNKLQIVLGLFSSLKRNVIIFNRRLVDRSTAGPAEAGRASQGKAQAACALVRSLSGSGMGKG